MIEWSFDGTDQRWTGVNNRHRGLRVPLHYPAHLWANQVEVFSSTRQRQCVRSGSVCSRANSGGIAFNPAWNRDRGASLPVDFHRLSAAGWRRPTSVGGGVRGGPRDTGQAKAPSPADSGRCRRPVSGDPRPCRPPTRRGSSSRRPLPIFVEDYAPVTGATPLGAGRFHLSFQTRTGRWELPVVADLRQRVHELVALLDPRTSGTDRGHNLSP
jgi:hypothetical protein